MAVVCRRAHGATLTADEVCRATQTILAVQDIGRPINSPRRGPQCVNYSFCILCLTRSQATSKSHSFYHPEMRLESLACHRSASRRRGEAQARICSRARAAQPEKVEKAPCEDGS